MQGVVAWLSGVESRETEKQAGAELCQAQVKLISFASLFSTFYAIELINQLCLPTT